MQDKSKPSWNNVQKYMAYIVFGLAGLKMYTYVYKSNLLFTFNPTNQNKDIINNCPTLRLVYYFYFDTDNN